MKATKSCEFSRVPVGATFFQNGTTYRKTSTRTAHLIRYQRGFYFGANENVTVTDQTASDIQAAERASS